MEKVAKAFLSADISLYKLSNKPVKNIFNNIGKKLLSKTTCRNTVVQLSADELQQIRNVVHD